MSHSAQVNEDAKGHFLEASQKTHKSYATEEPHMKIFFIGLRISFCMGGQWGAEAMIVFVEIAHGHPTTKFTARPAWIAIFIEDEALAKPLERLSQYKTQFSHIHRKSENNEAV